jgi:hypothetical protein
MVEWWGVPAARRHRNFNQQDSDQEEIANGKSTRRTRRPYPRLMELEGLSHVNSKETICCRTLHRCLRRPLEIAAHCYYVRRSWPRRLFVFSRLILALRSRIPTQLSVDNYQQSVGTSRYRPLRSFDQALLGNVG